MSAWSTSGRRPTTFVVPGSRWQIWRPPRSWRRKRLEASGTTAIEMAIGRAKRSPAWHVRRHQRFEDASVIADLQVQQLVNDDGVLNCLRLTSQVERERDDASSRTRAPLVRHRLHADDLGLRSHAFGPVPRAYVEMRLWEVGAHLKPCYSSNRASMTRSTILARSSVATFSSGM